MDDRKPIKVKPAFYSYCYYELAKIASDMGYNLMLHGSLNRDLDLVAVAWVDNPAPMIDVVIAFDKFLRGTSYTPESANAGYGHTVLAGGRNSFHISLNRGGRWNQYIDEQWYLDISFSPLPGPLGDGGQVRRVV